MLLLATILVIGLLLGLGLGGNPRNLAEVRIRLWWLLPVALVLQVVPLPRLGGSAGPYLPFGALMLSFLLITVTCVANWGLRGFPTILLGVLLNAAPIAVNQGMPVSAEAVATVGGSVEDLPTRRGEKHHLATPRDQLIWLGDVIPIREPFRAVVSAGDLAMWVGAAGFVTAGLLGRERRREQDLHPPRPSTTSGTRR